MNDDNGKIRVLVFELDGSNATLQESLRTIANAFGMGQTVMRSTLEQSPQVSPSIRPTTSTEVVDVEAKSQEQTFPPEETIRTTNPRSKRKQKFQTPKILDIDLTSGSLPFETFCEMKANPRMDTKRYLLIAAWFKEHLNLEAITTDHVYTCYRFMGWNIPKDPSKPFRNMKTQGYVNQNGQNLWEINHVGLNSINKLGAS